MIVEATKNSLLLAKLRSMIKIKVLYISLVYFTVLESVKRNFIKLFGNNFYSFQKMKNVFKKLFLIIVFILIINIVSLYSNFFKL